MFKKLAKNTTWLMLAELLGKGGYGVAILLIGIIYGKLSLGDFSVAYAYCTIFFVLADFGFTQLATREIARNTDKAGDYFGTMLILKIFLAVLTIVVIYSSTLFLNYTKQANFLIYILTFYIILNSFNLLSSAIFRAHEQMYNEVYLRLVEGVSFLVLASYFFYFKYSLTFIVLSFVISSALAFCFSLWFIRSSYIEIKFKFDKKLAKNILTQAWPFALASIFVILYFKIDTVLLQFYKGPGVVGLYNASYIFLYGALIIPTFLNAAIFPSLSRNHKKLFEIKSKIIVYALFTLSFGTIICVFYLFASPFLISIFPNEFAESVLLLRVLALVLPFLFLNTFLGTLLMSVNQQKKTLYVMVTLTFINIALNLFLIPKLAAYGSSLATVITEIIGVALYLAILYKVKVFASTQTISPVATEVPSLLDGE